MNASATEPIAKGHPTAAPTATTGARGIDHSEQHKTFVVAVGPMAESLAVSKSPPPLKKKIVQFDLSSSPAFIATSSQIPQTDVLSSTKCLHIPRSRPIVAFGVGTLEQAVPQTVADVAIANNMSGNENTLSQFPSTIALATPAAEHNNDTTIAAVEMHGTTVEM